MKKFLLLFVVLFSVNESKSQVVFEIISNSCDTNTLGNYSFEYAGELDGSSTDWGCPDITNPANAVQGCLVLINDGTSGFVISTSGDTIPTSTLGCDTSNYLMQDLTGKIAVIYRGSCQFGLKAYNAQLRGAIGVIIINVAYSLGNSDSYPIPMSGGMYGIQDTIPVISISRVDGVVMSSCLDIICSGVDGFIGNRIGYYNNNMSSSIGDILMTQELAIPQNLINISTPNYSMDLGIWMYNLGVNAQTGVTANVSVTKNGNVVYAQTSVPLNFSAPNFSDSSNIIIDTQYVDLGAYIPDFGYWYQGDYLVEYAINNLGDEDLSDNLFSYVFKVTDYTYSKSRIDNNNKPIHNSSYAVDETNFQYDNWETCVVLNKLNSSYVDWNIINGMTFSASPVNVTMSGEFIEIKAYKWNDNFLDITSLPTFNSLVQIAEGYYFFSGTSDSLDNHFASFNSQFTLENNQRYLFCIYNASDELRINYDKEPNYKATINHYNQPITPFKTETDFGLVEWDWKGLGYDMTPAISVYVDYLTSVNDEKVSSASTPYPNPTTNLLTVPVRKGVSGNVKVEVFDLTGKLVLSENQHIGNEPLKVNVASIKNGTYLFQLTFVDGTTDVFKISVNR